MALSAIKHLSGFVRSWRREEPSLLAPRAEHPQLHLLQPSHRARSPQHSPRAQSSCQVLSIQRIKAVYFQNTTEVMYGTAQSHSYVLHRSKTNSTISTHDSHFHKYFSQPVLKLEQLSGHVTKNHCLCCYKKNFLVARRGGTQQHIAASPRERAWKPFPAPTLQCPRMAVVAPGEFAARHSTVGLVDAKSETKDASSFFKDLLFLLYSSPSPEVHTHLRSVLWKTEHNSLWRDATHALRRGSPAVCCSAAREHCVFSTAPWQRRHKTETAAIEIPLVGRFKGHGKDTQVF